MFSRFRGQGLGLPEHRRIICRSSEFSLFKVAGLQGFSEWVRASMQACRIMG